MLNISPPTSVQASPNRDLKSRALGARRLLERYLCRKLRIYPVNLIVVYSTDC